ncbi:MAG: ABC transporter substrate-binding protein [Patescibacteria group bacterium]|nr:ABC transporter substrate-binding protein [Patescibacteria group bacterium]
MRKIIIISLVVLLIIGIGTWLGLEQRKEAPVINIGVVSLMSGNMASYGERAQKGLSLAMQDIQKEFPGLKIQLFYEDSRYSPQDGVSAYRKLRDFNNAQAVIVLSSPVALAIAPLANQEKVIEMAITASTPKYTTKNDFTFRTTARAEVEDRALAKAVMSKYKDVALFYINDERGLGHRDAIRAEIEKAGGRVVAQEIMAPGDSDFRAQLTKIKAEKPEAIYVLTEAKSTGLFVKQAKEMGIESQIFATRSTQEKDFLAVAGNAAEGIIYTYSFDPASNNPQVKDFTQRFKARYQEEPDYVAAEAYDSLRLVVAAVEACGLKSECMKDYLLSVKNYQGVSGNLSFDENGDVFYEYSLKTVKNGEFVPYQQ